MCFLLALVLLFYLYFMLLRLHPPNKQHPIPTLCVISLISIRINFFSPLASRVCISTNNNLLTLNIRGMGWALKALNWKQQSFPFASRQITLCNTYIQWIPDFELHEICISARTLSHTYTQHFTLGEFEIMFQPQNDVFQWIRICK